jgi:hypothetical protein
VSAPTAAVTRGFRCSFAADVRGDSMVATAPPAQRWLLLEHPGPWPVNAVEVFDPWLARGLDARAETMQARISLIRRPGRHPREPGPFRWAVADVRPGQEGIRWRVAEHEAEILAVDWEVAPGEGEPVALVCAHSRHDVCCALRGRPAAAALDDEWPGRVWECSHLGGDRFAATMVVLPHALYYGRVAPDVGVEILRAHARGEVRPDHLRGRCAFSRHEQAAQALAWAHGLGPTGVGSLWPITSRPVEPGVVEVVLAGDPPLQVVLRERVVPLGTPATCRSIIEAVGHEYELVAAGPTVTP